MGAGAPLTHVAPPVTTPFGSAAHVEHDRIRVIDVGAAAAPPPGVAFLDGIQRYAVEGRFGLVPVVRGYAAAAVMRRDGESLGVVETRAEEFVVVAMERLEPRHREAIQGAGLPVIESEVAERSHPILDLQLAAREVERRREALETELAGVYVAAEPGSWLVVDGAIGGLGDLLDAAPPVVGLVKSHETQFLEGQDLEAALTLPAGCRTTVFARTTGERRRVYTWYLRLWPWEEEQLLHGLVRIERPPHESAVARATEVSCWVLAERAPLSAPDSRWDRLIYPIQQVETFLRAQAGGWW